MGVEEVVEEEMEVDVRWRVDTRTGTAGVEDDAAAGAAWPLLDVDDTGVELPSAASAFACRGLRAIPGKTGECL